MSKFTRDKFPGFEPRSSSVGSKQLICYNRCLPKLYFCFLNGQPRPLFRLFCGLLKQTIHFLNQINVKYIRCQDSNPWPLKRKSSPITTRPGLQPKNYFYLINFNAIKWWASHFKVCKLLAVVVDSFYFVHFSAFEDVLLRAIKRVVDFCNLK